MIKDEAVIKTRKENELNRTELFLLFLLLLSMAC